MNLVGDIYTICLDDYYYVEETLHFTVVTGTEGMGNLIRAAIRVITVKEMISPHLKMNLLSLPVVFPRRYHLNPCVSTCIMTSLPFV